MSRQPYHPLRVARIIEETADARSIVFEVPDELRETFSYKPGQFLTLRVPCGERPQLRCYSASSSPLVDEPLRVTVKRVADGRASNWLCGCLRAGDTLQVAPPSGIFTPRSLDADLLMFAGGSGITPVFSIIRSVLLAGRGRVRLIYANRDERSVIFAGELARLSREHPGRLQVVHWLDSVQGIASQAQLAALCECWEGAECFICGPGVFMDATAAALHDLGVPHARMHIERFVSLPDDADDERAPLPVDPTAESFSIEATLDGATRTVGARSGQLLIDALEAGGLQPPFSCRAGACAACMCRLEDGEIELLHNHVLEQSDLDQGWILACQAVVRSDVRVRYPD